MLLHSLHNLIEALFDVSYRGKGLFVNLNFFLGGAVLVLQLLIFAQRTVFPLEVIKCVPFNIESENTFDLTVAVHAKALC